MKWREWNKPSETISTIYRTIGSYAWLSSLTDDEIKRLDQDVISVFREEMAARKIVPTRPEPNIAAVE